MLASHACFLLLIAMLAPSFATAQTFTLIHESPTHAIIEIGIKDLTSSVINANGIPFVEMRAPGFEESGALGGPMRLRAARLISIPKNKTPKIQVLSSKHQLITLKHLPKFYSGKETHCASTSDQIKMDQELYRQVSNEPVLDLTTAEFIGPVRAALLRFNPLQYEVSYQKARLTESLVVRIDYIDRVPVRAPVNSANLAEADLSFYKSLFINKQGLPAIKKQTRKQIDLIIADETLRDGVQGLVAYKEDQGRAVVLKFFNSATTNDIKAFIQDQYAQTNPPSHTILVGDINQIPSFRYQDFWSDYPYSLIDSGVYPDLSIGRISAKNNTELKNAVAKFSSREKVARQNESLVFISSASETRCHNNLADYKLDIFSNGQNSFEIKTLDASDKSYANAFMQALQLQPNLIINDAAKLDQELFVSTFKRQRVGPSVQRPFPLLFDLTCMASSWPSDGASKANTAERILALAQSGAAGILASTSQNDGHDLFRHILSASVYDGSKPDAPFHQINEVGQMIQFGKIRNLEQYSDDASALRDNYMFLYHGDPASTLFSITQ